jgi:predicted MFS family arabinose efflux permease
MSDATTQDVRRPGLRAVAASSFVATAGVLPVFLLGAVAVLVRAELGFSEAQLGLVISAFWGTAALVSVPSGSIVERLGDRGSLVVGVVGSGLAMAGMATARSFWPLVVWTGVAGLANSVGQLAANLRLASSVALRRQGLAFGFKQSANPLATLAGGVAVPAIALTVGWRWVFAAGAAMSVIAGVVLSRRRSSVVRQLRIRRPKVDVDRRPLVMLGIAATFGAASVTSMAGFVVEYAVSVGIPTGTAGLILAVGSITAVSVRIGVGWSADRRTGGSLRVVIAMLASGGVAFACFPFATSVVTLGIVTVLAYAFGWGWPGLFNLAIIRGNPHAPAAATGVTQVGAYAGGVSGPLVFGLLVAGFGYRTAWWSSACWLLLAAALMALGRRAARRAWLPATRTGGSGASA